MDQCWWSVTPTGDYAKDYDQGRTYMRLLLPLLKYNVGGPLLSWIVIDMIAAGDHNAIVLGFAREIAEQLKSVRLHLLLAAISTDPGKLADPLREDWKKRRSKIVTAMADAL